MDGARGGDAGEEKITDDCTGANDIFMMSTAWISSSVLNKVIKVLKRQRRNLQNEKSSIS